METTVIEQAEALGYEWAEHDEDCVGSVADWINGAIATHRQRDSTAKSPEADGSYLPVDAGELLRELLTADPAQTLDELRRAAVAGYTRKLVEIWRELDEDEGT